MCIVCTSLWTCCWVHVRLYFWLLSCWPYWTWSCVNYHMRFQKGWSQETDNEIMGKRTILSCVRYQCDHAFTSRPCTKIAAEQEWKYQKRAVSRDAYRAHLTDWAMKPLEWIVQRPSWFLDMKNQACSLSMMSVKHLTILLEAFFDILLTDI